MNFFIVVVVAAIIMVALQAVSPHGDASPARDVDQLYEGKILQDDLTIISTCEFYAGPAKGSTTLSLGERIVRIDSTGMLIKPIRHYIVPGHGYRVGQRLDRLPEGSMPVDLFFAAHGLSNQELGKFSLPPLFLLLYIFLTGIIILRL